MKLSAVQFMLNNHTVSDRGPCPVCSPATHIALPQHCKAAASVEALGPAILTDYTPIIRAPQDAWAVPKSPTAVYTRDKPVVTAMIPLKN